MIDVIQILKSVERIEKSDYSTETRQLVDQWGDKLVSKTGYLTDSTLCLPTDARQEPDLKTADLVIIQDIRSFDPFLAERSWGNANLPDWFKNSRKSYVLSTNRQLICFNALLRLWAFEIFRIKKNKSGSFNIHLSYSANEFHIGIPKRDDHKIAELKLHKPIRYKVNGKSDFAMTGRKQRTFVEYDYIFEYLGQADKIEFRDLSKIEKTKIIPTNNYKLIDERKVLK